MLTEACHEVFELDFFKMAVFLAIVIGIIVFIHMTKEEGLIEGVLLGIGAFILISVAAYVILLVILVGGAWLLLIIGIILGLLLF